MSELFKHSEFNGDISQWNVSKVQCMNNMFYNSKFNEDISNWNLISLTDMVETFKESKFTGDLSKQILDKLIELSAAFDNCEGDKPWWNIEDYQTRQETIVKYHLVKKLEKKLVTKKEINKSKKIKI